MTLATLERLNFAATPCLHFADTPPSAPDRAHLDDIADRLLRTIDTLTASSPYVEDWDTRDLEELRDVTLADILRAFCDLYYVRAALSFDVRYAIGYIMEQRGSVECVVDALIEIEAEHAAEIHDLVGTVVLDISGMDELAKTTRLSGLSDAAFSGLGHDFSRSEYMRGLVTAAQHRLTSAQYDLACVLARDWPGTFETLEDTVRLLHPSAD